MLIWMGSQEGDGQSTMGKKKESRGAVGWWLSSAQLGEPWGPWRATLHLSALALNSALALLHGSPQTPVQPISSSRAPPCSLLPVTLGGHMGT